MLIGKTYTDIPSTNREVNPGRIQDISSISRQDLIVNGCKKTGKELVYDNNVFDTFCELCFYIFMRDKMKRVVRNPNGFCGFDIDGKLVEIEDGNPDPERRKELIEKHVVIIRPTSIILRGAVRYVQEEYGREFIGQFIDGDDQNVCI